MPQKPQIRFAVDPDIWEAFKNHVFAKYGTLHKYLGEKLSRAMELYLKDSWDAQTQNADHIFSKPNKRHLQLLIWLLKECPKEALYSEIRNYIADNYRIDPRTIKKYLHDFLISGKLIEIKKQLKNC